MVSYIAPAIFIILWSTGFIGAKFGLPYSEPFTFLFVRFLISFLVLSLLAIYWKSELPREREDIIRIAFAGLLLHAGFLGGVFNAINLGMSAGLTALIMGLQPILTGIFAQRLLKERVLPKQWLGLVLGFVGLIMVIGEKAFSHQLPSKLAIIAVLWALLSSTYGTIYQKFHCSSMPLLSGTAIQYATTALVMLVGMLLFETPSIEWTHEFVFAMAWLVIALSIGAILLLLYLIRHYTTSRVTSLFYLVPPATAIEAFILFDEELGVVAILGMLVVATGVFVVMNSTQKGNLQKQLSTDSR